MKNMSIEEARELAELTDRIAANLGEISDDRNNFEELEGQTNAIARNLRPLTKTRTISTCWRSRLPKLPGISKQSTKIGMTSTRWRSRPCGS
jgi:hypothetical protein